MRSVVVVLPASMCAMMPIFLQRSNGTCLATVSSVSLYAALRPLSTLVARATSPRNYKTSRCHPERRRAVFARRSRRTPIQPEILLPALPAVMREGLVGLGHAMHVIFLLDGCATAIGRVEQLVGQLVNHAFFATSAAVLQDPADGQRHAAIGVDFHRHLVVRATDAPSLDFQHRLGVPHGLLEQLGGPVATLLFKLLHGVIEDGLGGRLLPVPHHGG